MGRILRIILIIFFLEHTLAVASAALEIVSVFPNTIDDKNLEYFEVRNTGCTGIDLSGYTLQDALPNPYIIQGTRIIEPRTTLRFTRPETKIELNNTNERIDVLDPAKSIVATYTYTTSTKGVVITRNIVDDTCTDPVAIIGSGASSTGTTDSGSVVDSGSVASGSLTSTGTTDTNTTHTGITTLTGSESNTGNTLPESSGSIDTGSGAYSGGYISSSTGIIIMDSGSILTTSGTTPDNIVYTETGILIPLSLVYDDIDANQHIDTLEITYPYVLTGVVNTGAILFFSKTGGLDSSKIDTETGYIISGSLSGMILILKIKEGNLEKNILSISDTTMSDLRLKSSIDLGFRSLGGQKPEDFLLTKSFDNYKNVSRKVLVSSPPSSIPDSTGTGTIDDQTGAVLFTGTLTPFPDLDITLQSPSNVTQSGQTLHCIGDTPCRVNMNLEPIFSSAHPMRDYVCEVIFSGSRIEDCNPSTFYFDANDAFSIILKHKVLTGSVVKTYDVMFPVANISDSGSTSFPELLPTLQSPTNATLSGSVFLCDSANLPCRINLNLEPIFSTGFQMKEYDCLISTGSTDMFDCNPNTLYFNTESTLTISLEHKATLEKIERTYEISFVRNQAGPPGVATLPKINHPPVAILDHDGKWKSYYEQIDDYHLLCYTMTCSINFTAERSYDADTDPLTFLWIYDYQIVKTSRDPGSYTMGIGPHWIILRVFDTDNMMSEIRYKVEVLGEKEIPTKEKKKKPESNIKKSTHCSHQVVGCQNEESSKKKRKKIKPIVFFNPPKIQLQKQPTGVSYSGNVYHCTTKKKTCSLNFTLDETYKGYQYEWRYPKSTQAYISKNPKSFAFERGTSQVLLTVKNGAGNIVTEEKLTILVDRIEKQKKKKNPVKTSKKTSNISKNNSLKVSIEAIDAILKQSDSIGFPVEHATVIFFLSGGLVSNRYIRRRLRNQ